MVAALRSDSEAKYRDYEEELEREKNKCKEIEKEKDMYKERYESLVKVLQQLGLQQQD
jgi:hypothetical protein